MKIIRILKAMKKASTVSGMISVISITILITGILTILMFGGIWGVGNMMVAKIPMIGIFTLF